MINVNTVYQTVLLILNKEQRGYMTPNEFNNIGVQVQQEIYNSYFPNADQFNRKNQQNVQNDTEWFNAYENALTKIDGLIYYDAQFSYASASSSGEQVPYHYIDSPTILNGRNIRQIGNVIASYNVQGFLNENTPAPAQFSSVCERVTKKECNQISRSRLTAPTKKNPVYYIYNLPDYNGTSYTTHNFKIKVLPDPDAASYVGKPLGVKADLLLTPKDCLWSFNIDPNIGAYIYDPTTSVDFDLHISEQANVIMRILLYAGVVIRDPQIVQAAATEIQKEQINAKS